MSSTQLAHVPSTIDEDTDTYESMRNAFEQLWIVLESELQTMSPPNPQHDLAVRSDNTKGSCGHSIQSDADLEFHISAIYVPKATLMISDPVTPPQQTDFLSCFSSDALEVAEVVPQQSQIVPELMNDVQITTPNDLVNIESDLIIENVNVASLVEYDSWSDDEQPSRRRKCPKCVR
jgi:hypothetical protein